MSKKNIASLIIKSITVVFLMFATVVASVAWLTNNKNVKNKDIQMGIHTEDAQATFYIYRYNIDTSEVDKITCAVTQDVVTPMNLVFNQYDTVFVDRNKYTPMIIRVDVDSTNLGLASGETGTVSLNLIRSIASRMEEKLYTSDILRFTVVDARTVSINSLPSDIRTIYNNFSSTELENFNKAINGEITEETMAANTSTYANVYKVFKAYNNALYDGFLEDYYEKTKNATVVANNNLTSKSFNFSLDSTFSTYHEITIYDTYNSNDSLTVLSTDGDDTLYRLTLYLFVSYDEALISEVINSQGATFGSQEVDFHNDLTLINVINNKQSQGGN